MSFRHPSTTQSSHLSASLSLGAFQQTIGPEERVVQTINFAATSDRRVGTLSFQHSGLSPELENLSGWGWGGEDSTYLMPEGTKSKNSSESTREWPGRSQWSSLDLRFLLRKSQRLDLKLSQVSFKSPGQCESCRGSHLRRWPEPAAPVAALVGMSSQPQQEACGRSERHPTDPRPHLPGSIFKFTAFTVN